MSNSFTATAQAEAPSQVERSPSAAEAPSTNALRNVVLNSIQDGSANKALTAMTVGAIAGNSVFSAFNSRGQLGKPAAQGKPGTADQLFHAVDEAQANALGSHTMELAKTVQPAGRSNNSKGFNEASPALVHDNGATALVMSDAFKAAKTATPDRIAEERGRAAADKKYGFAA